MTTNAYNINGYDNLISKLESLLLDAYDVAQDAKFEAEPMSKERRKLMYVTSALESVITTVHEA